jgi:hypothetical protein
LIDHLAGYVLLGIALLRARVIPAWAAWLQHFPTFSCGGVDPRLCEGGNLGSILV